MLFGNLETLYSTYKMTIYSTEETNTKTPFMHAINKMVGVLL